MRQSKKLWVQSQFLNSILRCLKFKMSFKEKWLRKFHVSCVVTFLIKLLSVNNAISYSVNTANSSFKMKLNWMDHLILKNNSRQVVVQTVRSVEISCKTLIKFSKTVLISVNSHINVIVIHKLEPLFGRLCLIFKSMPCMNVPNLDVISVIKNNSNTWLEHSFFSISRGNAQLSWFNVRSVMVNLIVLNLPHICALKICLFKSFKKMSLRYLSISQSIWWCLEDQKKVLVSAWEKNALKDSNKANQNNQVKVWLHQIQPIKLLNVRGAKQSFQVMKIASTVYIVVMDFVLLVSGTQNTLIWMSWRL
jgi:hypothetical protein